MIPLVLEGQAFFGASTRVARFFCDLKILLSLKLALKLTVLFEKRVTNKIKKIYFSFCGRLYLRFLGLCENTCMQGKVLWSTDKSVCT